MRKIIYFVLIISFTLIIPEYHAQLTIGVSPPLLDLGELEPGTSKIARFYLVTSSEEKFFVHMNPTGLDVRTFMTTRYKEFGNNYSEEDVSSWVEFLSNPVELKEPKERQIKLLTELAFEKGIPHSVEVAKRLDSPYILDEFHDALVDELYNKLIGEGKLKRI